METLVAISSLLHPLLLCSAVVFAGHAAAGTTGPAAAAAVIVVAPWFTASCGTRTFLSWCFGPIAESSRALPTLAGCWALAAALQDPRFLDLAAAALRREETGVLPIVSVLLHSSSVAILTSAAVMLLVLTIELPIRWGTAACSGREADLLPRGFRWIGVSVLLAAGWYLVAELCSTELTRAAGALGGD